MRSEIKELENKKVTLKQRVMKSKHKKEEALKLRKMYGDVFEKLRRAKMKADYYASFPQSPPETPRSV